MRCFIFFFFFSGETSEKEKVAFAISILSRRNNLEISFVTFLPKMPFSHHDSFSSARHCLSSSSKNDKVRSVCRLFFNTKSFQCFFYLSLVLFLLFPLPALSFQVHYIMHIIYFSFCFCLSAFFCPCYVLLTDLVVAHVLLGSSVSCCQTLEYRQIIIFFLPKNHPLRQESD